MEAYQAFSNIMLSIQQSQRQQLQAIEYCLIQLLQGVQPDCYLTLRQNLSHGRLYHSPQKNTLLKNT